MFDGIRCFENIIYDKAENNFLFISEFDSEYDLVKKIENDEEVRYYFLPSRYGFHDSEIIDEYIYNVDNDNIRNELDYSFYGRGKYRRFKETLRSFGIEEDYYKFRYNYLKNCAIEWCNKNSLEYDENN